MHHLLNCFSKRWPTFSRACLPGLRNKAALKSEIQSDGTSPVPDANHRTGGCSFRKAEPSQSKGGGSLPSKKTAEYTSSLSTSQLPQSWLLLLLLIILTSTCGFTTSISLLWTEGCRERWRREVSWEAKGKLYTGGQSGARRLLAAVGTIWLIPSVSSELPQQYVELTGDPGPAAGCHFLWRNWLNWRRFCPGQMCLVNKCGLHLPRVSERNTKGRGDGILC